LASIYKAENPFEEDFDSKLKSIIQSQNKNVNNLGRYKYFVENTEL
jgi:hypothetical protein